MAARIAKHIAAMIPDGAEHCKPVSAQFPGRGVEGTDHAQRFGRVYRVLFADGVIDLVERGRINGERKSLHPGKKIVAGFMLGTQRLYDCR
ncbi:MAG: hypothetical protein U0559_09145 [Anaerolineae bacterium]